MAFLRGLAATTQGRERQKPPGPVFASALAVRAPEVFSPELLRAAHRPVYGVPVRRDFLQRASRIHGSRLKPLDHPLDFRQAPLDVKELAPDAVQFLRENLVLAALVALARDARGL